MDLENILYGSVETIIVFVNHRNSTSWFVSDRELWIMDYGKYSRAFDPNDNDFSGRFDIEVLNHKTFDFFFREMHNFKYETLELKKLLGNKIVSSKDWDDISYFLPSLYLDINNKKLYSLYSESLQFENYVPPTWKGSYDNFYDKIPLENQYWIINGIDYVRKYIGNNPLGPPLKKSEK